MHFSIFSAQLHVAGQRRARGRTVVDVRDDGQAPRLGIAKLAYLAIFAKFCKFLAGSFSAVSKRKFARKYAFDSIFQALQDVHTSAQLQSQNFRKKSVWKIRKFYENSAKILQTSQNLQILPKFKNFSLTIW